MDSEPSERNNPSPSELILYRTEDGGTEVHLRVDGDTVWLTQLEIADLFATTKQNVSLHIRNILKEGELSEDSVVKDSLTTASDGKRYTTKIYSLPMILAVGYRVRSPRGTEFRQWATRHLSEYLVKGFVMDDKRLPKIWQSLIGEFSQHPINGFERSCAAIAFSRRPLREEREWRRAKSFRKIGTGPIPVPARIRLQWYAPFLNPADRAHHPGKTHQPTPEIPPHRKGPSAPRETGAQRRREPLTLTKRATLCFIWK